MIKMIMGILGAIFTILVILTIIFVFINSKDPNMSAAGWTVLGGIIIAGIFVAIGYAKR